MDRRSAFVLFVGNFPKGLDFDVRRVYHGYIISETEVTNHE